MLKKLLSFKELLKFYHFNHFKVNQEINISENKILKNFLIKNMPCISKFENFNNNDDGLFQQKIKYKNGVKKILYDNCNEQTTNKQYQKNFYLLMLALLYYGCRKSRKYHSLLGLSKEDKKEYNLLLQKSFEAFFEGNPYKGKLFLAKATIYNKKLEEAFILLEKRDIKAALKIFDAQFKFSKFKFHYELLKVLVDISRNYMDMDGCYAEFIKRTQALKNSRAKKFVLDIEKKLLRKNQEDEKYFFRFGIYIQTKYVDCLYPEIIKMDRSKIVIVRTWRPVNRGETGHVSLETDKYYISFWPGDAEIKKMKNYKNKNKAKFIGGNYNSLIEDILAYDELPADSGVFYHLDVQKINEEFLKFKGEKNNWHLLGSFLGGKKNCSGLVYYLLKIGRAKQLKEKEPLFFTTVYSVGAYLLGAASLPLLFVKELMLSGTAPVYIARWIERESIFATKEWSNHIMKEHIEKKILFTKINSFKDLAKKVVYSIKYCDYLYQKNYYSFTKTVMSPDKLKEVNTKILTKVDEKCKKLFDDLSCGKLVDEIINYSDTRKKRIKSANWYQSVVRQYDISLRLFEKVFIPYQPFNCFNKDKIINFIYKDLMELNKIFPWRIGERPLAQKQERSAPYPFKGDNQKQEGSNSNKKKFTP